MDSAFSAVSLPQLATNNNAGYCACNFCTSVICVLRQVIGRVFYENVIRQANVDEFMRFRTLFLCAFLNLFHAFL